MDSVISHFNIDGSDVWFTVTQEGIKIGTLRASIGQGVHTAPLLQTLWVEKAKRRQGIAVAMIREAEDYLLAHSESRVFAVTHPENLETRALFKKLGYSEMILLERKLGDDTGRFNGKRI